MSEQLAASLADLTFAEGAPGYGAIKLKFGVEFFNHNFSLSAETPHSPAPSWVPTKGRYNNLQGYWMFHPTENRCWQAVNANGPLRYWNEDGQAAGNPEDWELFVFENTGGGNVRIKNVYGKYVAFTGGQFVCNAGQGQAATFQLITA